MFRFRRDICLDANATTAPDRSVVREMRRVQERIWGNPASPHSQGRVAALLLDGARRTVQEAFGATGHEVVFTSGATEAANQVIASVAHAIVGTSRRRILASPTEHACVLEALEAARSLDCEVEFLPVDSAGRVCAAVLRERMGEDVALVCCMLANNETGTVQDVPGLSEIVHESGARFLCDCVQAAGRIPVDVAALGVDYAFVSGHKFHGPKGVGALFVRDGLELAPLLHGGHQEGGHRAGTENLPAIAGLAQACRGLPGLLRKSGHVARLRDELCELIRAACPQAEFHSSTDGLPNTVSVRFPGILNGQLLGFLDSQGIQVGAGSACNTAGDQPSHVLVAMGMGEQAARETLRFSLSAGGPNPVTMRDLRTVGRALAEFFGGRSASVGVLWPRQLDEAFLSDQRLWILDARHGYDRKLIPSLPRSHEIAWPYGTSLEDVPSDRHVLVVCQAGLDAAVLAWKLRRRGVRHVSFLALGMVGWKLSGVGRAASTRSVE